MHGRCTGTNRDGSPCSGQARPGRPWCSWHDPALDAQRAGWRQKGGAARSNKARAKKALPAESLTLQEVQGLLSVALKGVLTGRIEPGIANASANVARAIAAVAQAGEIEERIAALEAAAQIGGKRA